VLQNNVVVIKSGEGDIRMSGAIVKSPNVRVEEITHAFLLFAFDLEQLSWHGK